MLNEVSKISAINRFAAQTALLLLLVTCVRIELEEARESEGRRSEARPAGWPRRHVVFAVASAVYAVVQLGGTV